MRRALVLLLMGTLGATGLTACMSDEDESASALQQRRAAALISTAAGGYQLTIDGLTPAGQAIEVESFSWGVTNSKTLTTAGKVNVQDMSITKKLDEVSPALFQAAATGNPYASAELKLITSAESGKPTEYMSYVLKNVLVSAVTHGGNNPSVPQEVLVLSYQSITQNYTPSAAEGKTEGPRQFGWDVQQSAELR